MQTIESSGENKMSAIERALAAAKAAKAAEREAKKAEKAAAKAASAGKPAHMKKVDRARSKLPPLSTPAEVTFNEVSTNLSIQQIEALAQHLLVQARAMRTHRAVSSPVIPKGTMVTITGGEPKYVGATGKVVHSQKLRLKVAVEGVKNPVYLYAGEAEPLAAAVAVA